MPRVPVSAVTGPTVISNLSVLGGGAAPASASATSSLAAGTGAAELAGGTRLAALLAGALAAGKALAGASDPERSPCASTSVRQRRISPLPLPMRPQGQAGSYG